MNCRIAQIDKIFRWLTLVILAGYLSGFFVVYCAILLTAIQLCWIWFVGDKTSSQDTDNREIFGSIFENRMMVSFLFVSIPLLVIELGVHLLLGIPLGYNGIDFAVFSQAIAAIAREGVPWVSLVSGVPINFLTHHFAPYLYVPGVLASLGVSAPVAGVLVHWLGLGAGLVALGGICRNQRLSLMTTLALVMAAAMSTTMRNGLSWTMNDELYGAPYVLLGLWAWLSGRYRLCGLAFGVACLCKETYFLVTLAFTGVALLWHTDFRPKEERRKAAVVLIPLGIIAGLIFVGYFFLQPVFLGKPFDHASKLATMTQLFSPVELGKKVAYLLTILGATFGVPLAFMKGRKLILVGAPGVALSLVSGFDQMYKPFSYYSVTPVLVSFVALAVSWSELRQRWRPSQLGRYVALLWVSAVVFEPINPVQSILRGVREPWVVAAQLPQLPADGVYVVDPAAATLLADHRYLLRLWGMNQTVDRHFDRLIWKPGGYEEPSSLLLGRTRECGSTEQWRVRCDRSAIESAQTKLHPDPQPRLKEESLGAVRQGSH